MDRNPTSVVNHRRPAIRILHVVDGLSRGGLENGLVNLIQRMDAERFEHTVLAIRGLGENADRLPQERVRTICLDKEETRLPVQAHVIARRIRQIKPDIVHSRNWAAIEAVLAAWWVGSNAIIHSEHGLEAATSVAEPWRRRRFRRLAYGLADRVLAVSHQLKDLHTKRTGFPADRFSVIHNGVDCRSYAPDAATREAVRAELGIAAGEFCIGAVGNLLPVKDHLTLLRALELLDGAWRLLVAGKGPELANLQAFVEARPDWKNRVHFLGGTDQVARILNAMDVYVLPSISEGISNSLLEAMATGLPVIASDTGGNPEVVVDGESGMLFPVGEAANLAALLHAWRGEAARMEFGRRGMEHVRRNFSIESMVANYEDLYESFAPLGARTVEAAA